MLIRAWQVLGERGGRMLDVGGGDGRMWVDFLANVPSVQYHSVEPFVAVVESARKALPEHAESIRVGRGEDIVELFDGEFDLIVSRSVLEHVVKREVFIRAMCSALAPGGLLLLTWGRGHFKEGLLTDIRNLASQALALGGVDRFYAAPVSEDALLDQLDRNGMQVVERMGTMLPDVKAAHKLISDSELRDSCTLRWLALEESLNGAIEDERFLRQVPNEVYVEITARQ
jgi:SAM-dependent methyltransferase